MDIEGHLTDVWPEPVPCAGGILPAGQPMHAMWLRFTVDKAVVDQSQALDDQIANSGEIRADGGQIAITSSARSPSRAMSSSIA